MGDRKDIYVFVVENEQLAKALIRDHFEKDGITYASMVDETKRDELVEAINKF